MEYPLFFFLGEDGNGRGFEGHPIGSERTSKKCEGERPVFDWFGPHVCASLSRDCKQSRGPFLSLQSTAFGPWTI